MDPELDHIICTVLSLEEDYPTMSPPLRNLNDPPSPNGELPNHLSIMNISDPNKVSNVLAQTLLELYSYLGYQQEEGNGKSINPDFSEQISKITSSRNSQENLSHNQNQKVLKRKLEEDQYERCKQPRVNIEDFQNSNSKSQCKKRKNFNEEQTAFLINEFDRNPYPNFTKRCHIAKISGVSEPRIQVWFQNRRARHLSKDMKSQIAQGSQFSTPRDLPHIVQNPYQNLQIDGQFQIPGNMWML